MSLDAITNAIPRPVLEAIESEVKGVRDGKAAKSAVLSFLVTFGLITPTTGSALIGLLGLVPALLAFWLEVRHKSQALYKAAATAEPLVTPVDAPALQVDGVRLPLVIDAAAPRHATIDPVTDAPAAYDDHGSAPVAYRPTS